MTRQELDELGRSDELTQEAIEMLIHDQSFFERVFEEACPLFVIPRGDTDWDRFFPLKPGEVVGP